MTAAHRVFSCLYIMDYESTQFGGSPEFWHNYIQRNLDFSPREKFTLLTAAAALQAGRFLIPNQETALAGSEMS